ncbi:MAG TPA: methyltransferase domain-containing protein [Thermodesulfobacteriota bacterium]
MTWNPECYCKFQRERFEPFNDLLKLVVIKAGMNVVDLGCGTGEITNKVADRLPSSSVLGIDSSPEMLNSAKRLERPGLSFKLCSIEDISGKWDLIFSNAAIHWVENHEELIPRLFSWLQSGGQIVIQVPSNHLHPTQTLLREIAGEKPFKKVLNGWVRNSPVLSISEYAESLYQSGGKGIVIFEKVYPHVLNDVDAIIDWMRGSVLIPYLDRLPMELQESFIELYRERLLEKWPKGPVFFPYQRILFAATHP